MPAIIWNESYNLGIQEIDEQHQRLVGMMNKIYEGIDNETMTKPELEEVLNRMLEYANSHFTMEEKYFHEFGYEKAQEHGIQHQQFRIKVADLKKESAENKESAATDALSYLANWFIDHTQTFDREYIQCFHEHGL